MLGSACVLPILSDELWDTVTLTKVAPILNDFFFSSFLGIVSHFGQQNDHGQLLVSNRGLCHNSMPTT